MALRAAAMTRKGVTGDAGALFRRLVDCTGRSFGNIPLCPPVHRGANGMCSSPSKPPSPESVFTGSEAAETIAERRALGRARAHRKQTDLKRAAGLWWHIAQLMLLQLLALVSFVTTSLGQNERLARGSEAASEWLLRVRQKFVRSMARGAGLTKQFSNGMLDKMGSVLPRPERVKQLMQKAVSYERHLDTKAAIRCYEAARKLEPSNLEALVGLAKCTSDRVFEPDVFKNDKLAREIAAQAAAFSEQAIALKPDNPRAYLAAAVALGRLALWSSNQRKIEISKTVREHVTKCLSLDPDDDVALHVLGRWEYEMACVGFGVRLVVRVVYGGMEVGSLDEAARCLKRAIDLAPHRLVHRVVFARILLRQGKKPEAVEQLDAALLLNVEDINAKLERAEAFRMRDKLGLPPLVPPLPNGIAPHPNPHAAASAAAARAAPGGGSGGGGASGGDGVVPSAALSSGGGSAGAAITTGAAGSSLGPAAVAGSASPPSSNPAAAGVAPTSASGSAAVSAGTPPVSVSGGPAAASTAGAGGGCAAASVPA